MFKFELLQMKDLKIMVDWYLKLSTENEVISYHHGLLIPEDFENILIQKTIDKDSEYNISELLQSYLNTLLEEDKEIFVNELVKTINAGILNQLSLIKRGYSIFISRVGGYTADIGYSQFTLIDSMIKKYPIFPNTEAKIYKLKSDNHWYASLGNFSIKDSKGNRKWETYVEAEKAVDRFLKTKN